MIQIVSCAPTQNTNKLEVVDVTAGVGTNLEGIIPLGNIPDERLSVSTTVKNTADSNISGIRIRSFLVRQGREDEISLQLGSDLRSADIIPGEVKTFSNGYMISKQLRPGPYRILLYIDSNISSDINSSNSIKYISNQVISIGAYVAGQGSVPVYSPNKITAPGTYMLMRDIQGGDAENIFRITTSGVTIDGQGHTISGLSNGYTAGIYVDGQSNLQDITVKNCNFDGVDFGIWFYRVMNGKILNCTINNCKVIGLRLDQCMGNTVSGNTLTGNELGIGVFQSSANIFSNNYFKNTFNAAVNAGLRNNWNLQPQQGTNIVGGSSIAGNAWYDLNGGGYSETAPDANNDGIVDSPFTINAENIDYYPLATVKASLPAPVPSGENVTESTAAPNTSTEQPAPGETTLQQPDSSNQSGFNGFPSPEPSATLAMVSPAHDSADLIADAIEAPASACTSDEITVNTTIENAGTLEAAHFWISYFLSENPVAVSLSDTEVGSHLIQSLKPGENLTLTDTLTIPSKVRNPLYSIGVIIDPGQDVYEDNTGNNAKIADHQIHITAC
jgi:parallel beta-helix repeat protein